MNWKRKPFRLINLVLLLVVFTSCSGKSQMSSTDEERQENQNGFHNESATADNDTSDSLLKELKQEEPAVELASNRMEVYLPLLKGKRIGVVANHTSWVSGKKQAVHLVDTLLKSDQTISRVFSPEHGFRGNQDAGAHVNHSTDSKTGLPIFSLHGKTKKPTVESLKNVDVMLFDLQDVGVRFYTYISTLHYVMEACAENNIPLIVLDRPNPNAHYVAGPLLNKKFSSFIGMHSVPVVYGMSIGEYAQMINGEKWLKDSVECQLTVVELLNWDHQKEYLLPVAPSPNLPNQLSVYLYPHLCFFEGTSASVGRGTNKPFQQYGDPNYKDSSYSFTPVSIEGASKYPPNENKRCFGVDLSGMTLEAARQKTELDLSYLLDAYQKVKPVQFFTLQKHFNLLAGNNSLIQSLQKEESLATIQQQWQQGIDSFLPVRAKYLIYP